MFPPDLSILRHTDPRPGEGAVSGRSSLPFPFPPPVDFPPHSHNRPWENIDAEDHQDALNIGHSVQCEDTKMVVSIEKESLKVSQEDLRLHIVTLWMRMEIWLTCISLARFAPELKGQTSTLSHIVCEWKMK